MSPSWDNTIIRIKLRRGTICMMAEALHVALGLFSTAMVCALVWRGSSGLAFKLAGSPTDRLLATLAIATVETLFVTTILASLGAFSGPVLAIVLTVISASLCFVPGQWWPGPSLARIRDVIRTEPALLAIGVIGLVPVLNSLIYAIPRPPLEYDPLNYHLVLAAHHLRTHSLSIFYFPLWYDPYSYMPAGTDLLAGVAIAPFGCDILLPVMNLPFLAMLLLSFWSLCRDIGLQRLPAAALSTAIAFMPLTFRVLTEAYAELPLWGTFMTSVRFMVMAANRSNNHAFLLAAALCGTLPSMKINGLVIAVVAFVIHVMVAGRRHLRRHFISHIVVFAVSIFVFGSSFYIRNAIETGNPFYPAPFFDMFPALEGFEKRIASSTIWHHLSFLLESGRLWEALIGVTGRADASWGLGPAGALVMVLACFSFIPPSGRRSSLAFLLGGIVLLVSYLFTPNSGTFLVTNVRFAVPGVLLLALAVAGAFANASPLVLTLAFLVTEIASFYFSSIVVTPHSGLLVVFLVTLCVIVSFYRNGAGPLPLWRKVLIAGGAISAFYVAVFALHHYREQNRFRYWREATAPHQQIVAGYVDCLEALERELKEGVVAVGADRGVASFIYPLLGSHMGRTIAYINIGKSDASLPHEHLNGNPRVEQDELAWLSRLAVVRPHILFTYLLEGKPPIEAIWARTYPELFKPIISNEACAVFRVIADKLPAF